MVRANEAAKKATPNQEEMLDIGGVSTEPSNRRRYVTPNWTGPVIPVFLMSTKTHCLRLGTFASSLWTDPNSANRSVWLSFMISGLSALGVSSSITCTLNAIGAEVSMVRDITSVDPSLANIPRTTRDGFKTEFSDDPVASKGMALIMATIIQVAKVAVTGRDTPSH